MSKLSRGEFKELLKEWNDNFINERGLGKKFHDNQANRMNKGRPEAYLISPKSEDLDDIISYIKNCIQENNVEELNDIKDIQSFQIGNGIIFPKNSVVLNIFKSYFQKSKKKQYSNIIDNASKDEDCIVIQCADGDFNIDTEFQEEKEIYHWAIHDIEHSLLRNSTSSYFYFAKGTLKLPQFSEIKQNKNSIGGVIKEILQEKINSFNENTLKDEDSELAAKFLNQIDYTKGVTYDDVHASIMSYCYVKMKSIKDLDNINDTGFDDDQKKRLKIIFTKYYTMTHYTYDAFKKVFKNCIILTIT